MWLYWIACTALLAAQDVRLPPPEQAKEAAPKQELPDSLPKPESTPAPSRPVYVFEGKPIQLELSCSDEVIHSFGLTCTPEEPCDVYLELAGIETVGAKLFLTGNLHTAAVTLWSVLLVSDDGGKTWTEAHERIRSAGLDQIQFIDFEYGWISGQLLLALPRDPFFLVTTDGGKTWRQRPVFSETRVGAIERFHFENRTAGTLLIDRTQSGEAGSRHELYETNTGGDTWTLRQVSPEPLKLRSTRIPNEDWLITTDAKTRSYRIEQRQGERRRLASSFLVNVGQCRPQQLQLAPPPEPEPPPQPQPEPDRTPPKKKRPTLKKQP